VRKGFDKEDFAGSVTPLLPGNLHEGRRILPEEEPKAVAFRQDRVGTWGPQHVLSQVRDLCTT